MHTLASFNVMDYAACKMHGRPCQGAEFNGGWQENNRSPQVLLPGWCEWKDSMEVVIRDTIV